MLNWNTELRRIILGLSSDQFQLLCWKYLRDLGYKAMLGPLEGRDSTHDIFGHTPNLQDFIAHCATTSQEHIRGKFLSDITNGVERCLRFNRPKNEIWFFSKYDFVVDPVQQTSLIQQTVPKIVDLDPRYRSADPVIHIMCGKLMAQQIARTRGTAFQHLLPFIVQPDVDPHALEDLAAPMPQSIHRLRDLLRTYTDDLTASYRLDILREILALAWSTLVFQPINAAILLSSIEEVAAFLRKPLLVFCNLALNMPQTPSDVGELLALLRAVSDNDDMRVDATLLMIKTFRALLYSQPDYFSLTEGKQQLFAFFSLRTPEIDEHILDVWYSVYCNYVTVPHSFGEELQEWSQLVRTEKPDHTLVELYHYIVSPAAIYKEHSKEYVTDYIKHLARRCTSPLVARWIIKAYDRMMPLYLADDEIEVGAAPLLDILNSFGTLLLGLSSNLLYLQCHSLLVSFFRTKDCLWIARFETRFLACHSRLCIPEISHLQLEYVAALYYAFELPPSAERDDLTFTALARSQAPLLQHQLFSNPLLSHRDARKPILSSLHWFSLRRSIIASAITMVGTRC